MPATPAANAAPAVTSTMPINSHTPSFEEWELQDGWLAGIIYQNIKDLQPIGITQDMRGSEGKASQWYNTPKGMEPIKPNPTTTAPITASNALDIPDSSITAATIYDLGSYSPGDWEEKPLPF
ncbi:hypothetical protein GYMLUDRAFT_239526 [Collybiopsis luxurians FD-317 M1]|nr:hypothetical protein GYMLUDRAFT_239526 [Collybiopsis luxurians FD-317 M1]